MTHHAGVMCCTKSGGVEKKEAGDTFWNEATFARHLSFAKLNLPDFLFFFILLSRKMPINEVGSKLEVETQMRSIRMGYFFISREIIIPWLKLEEMVFFQHKSPPG